ncbi:unnamed protein product [Scytosiphon promiscuus]
MLRNLLKRKTPRTRDAESGGATNPSAARDAKIDGATIAPGTNPHILRRGTGRQPVDKTRRSDPDSIDPAQWVGAAADYDVESEGGRTEMSEHAELGFDHASEGRSASSEYADLGSDHAREGGTTTSKHAELGSDHASEGGTTTSEHAEIIRSNSSTSSGSGGSPRNILDVLSKSSWDSVDNFLEVYKKAPGDTAAAPAVEAADTKEGGLADRGDKAGVDPLSGELGLDFSTAAASKKERRDLSNSGVTAQQPSSPKPTSTRPPTLGRSLPAWEGDQLASVTTVQPSSPKPASTHTPPVFVESVATWTSAEKKSFHRQMAAFPELRELARQNAAIVSEVRQLIPRRGVSSSPRGQVSGSSLSCQESLKELDDLVKMANILQEVVVEKEEVNETRRTELALAPDSMEGLYYATLRGGMCSSYLAASVIASDMVATSKTGAMGTAGKALNILAGAVSVAPGLKTLAAGLTQGDRFLQTRRIVKILEMAADIVECCALARRVALRLAGALVDDTLPEAHSRDEVACLSFERCGQDASFDVTNADEEAAMEWFIEEVLSSDVGSRGKKSNPSAKDGQRMGKQHLKRILKAVGRGCVREARGTDAKVDILVRVILPGIEGEPSSTRQGAQESDKHAKHPAGPAHPVSDPSREVTQSLVGGGGSIQSEACVTALTDKVQALEAGHASLKAKSAELAAQNAKLEAGLEASEVNNAELAARNCKLEAGLEASDATTAELEAGLKSSNAASAKLDAKNNKLEAGLEAANARSAELAARNDELKASVEASNAKRAELVARNDELKASVEESNSTSAELVAKNAELIAQNAELVVQTAELKAGLEESSATGAELDAQNGKLAKLESEVKSLKKQLVKLAPEPDSWVHSEGGQSLVQRAVLTEAADDFLERAQGREASKHPVTQCQFREFEAVMMERLQEVEAALPPPGNGGRKKKKRTGADGSSREKRF